MALLLASAESLNCTSQKFNNKQEYPNCTDLPHLGAYLHWNYNTSNSSLSIAFVAPPPSPKGWVAWAINPNSTKMVGSQALVAFKSDSTVTVQTYDIRSYNLSQSAMKLIYEVWDLSGEDSGGTIKIFGKWKLPAGPEKLNQVWQVGPGVSPQGFPMMHALQNENLHSAQALQLTGKEAVTPTSAPGPGESASGPSGSAPTAPSGGASRRGLGVGFSMAALVILGSLISF